MTAKGYWICRVQVHDDEGYAEYVAAANPVYSAHGGTPIVRGGQYEGVEGSSRPRNVVIEFPSYRAALDCYNSPEYVAARAIRQRVAEADIVVVEGPESS
ncbi:hypothetical protein GCM10011492_18670 [Flexivirga endophytica]|uniref:DUF1330 domain-containing protein n=1 Tax=Flexivirga endophytica TaxID=1849103 RepID=A0A916WTD1_9MICO|nr:DUF1330 domain-containing protein [Flexivirga endophytica]GGB28671.1 hypothetical protein GCM10011492_18670 [Flexivirga endophytica]GHB62347.1 hypothetical protein GCM10008112_34360 [Flexivirga endophytica]